MILAVLLKQVEFIYARSGKDPQKDFVAAVDRLVLNNPLDEVALEQAVRIKESSGDVQVWAVSVGEHLIEKEARRILAMGADHFVYVYDPLWGVLDAWATAQILSAAVRKIGASLVLHGTVSLDLGRGEVGVYVAEGLSFPYVSNVVGLKLRSDDRGLLVERSLGKGDLQELEADYPLCIGVDKGLCEPRYPSRRDWLNARSREIQHWQSAEIGMATDELERRIHLGPMVAPNPRPKWIPPLDGGLPAFERAEWLLSGTRGDKGGTMLEGDPKELASSLVKFLQDKQLI